MFENNLESKPLGVVDRLKAAGRVMVHGKLPNPLAEAPKDLSRAGLVLQLTDWCRNERTFWKPVYDRMQSDQDFAAGKQWPGEAPKEGEDCEYIGDIVQQIINRMVASLYAQNPTPEAKRLEKMLFKVWDGSQESLRGAQAILQQAATLPPEVDAAGMAVVSPQVQAALEIVNDYNAGMAEKKMLDDIAKTYVLVIKHQWRTHKPDFKTLMKQDVVQAVVSGVGFLQVGYRRDMEPSESEDSPISPADQMAAVQQKMRELEESDEKDSAPQREELRLMLQQLEQQLAGNEKVTFEGMVYRLIAPDAVIVDRRCTCLLEFQGARRIAVQSFLNIETVEKHWKVSLRDTGAVLYDEQNAEVSATDRENYLNQDGADGGKRPRVCVFHVYDKDAGLCYVICDGVKDFLEEPDEPKPAFERFWPLVPIALNLQAVTRNDPKKGVTIYPRSHIRLIAPMQENINHQGDEFQKHLVANRPWWAFDKSKVDEINAAKLAAPRQAHDAIGFNGMNDGSISDMLQAGPVPKIEYRLYDPAVWLQAAMLACGLQPANLGAQGTDEKATGQAIAEGARISVDQSNIDGVNFALSTIAHMTFEATVQEMSPATVRRIVGPGAMPVEARKEQIQEEMYIEVTAGSSGRPNQAVEAAKLKEIMPLALPIAQAMGIPLDLFLKKIIEVLGINVDIDELLHKQQTAISALPPSPNALGGAAGGVPGAGGPGAPLPAGTPAPNVMPPGGRQVAPSLPPQSRQQVAVSARG